MKRLNLNLKEKSTKVANYIKSDDFKTAPQRAGHKAGSLLRGGVNGVVGIGLGTVKAGFGLLNGFAEGLAPGSSQKIQEAAKKAGSKLHHKATTENEDIVDDVLGED